MINSPVTTISNPINAVDKAIVVADASAIPSPPNLLVIGGDTDDPETVKVTNVVGNTLTVDRAFQGVAQSWAAGTITSRNLTEYDYGTLKYNVEVLGAKRRYRYSS